MKINVIVTTYNHEKYIAQCLESVLQQKGDFQLEVIIGDDCSTDNTRKIVEEIRERYSEIISILPMEQNLGITKNLKRCLDACSGEYIAICEGDDYWTDEYKLQKQMTFLEGHLDFSMCFSAFMIYHQDLAKFEPFQDQLQLSKDVISTEDLILLNSIGNFSCCMYRTQVIRQLPDELFDLFTVDWMFNMFCGQFGKIGFIRDWMSVYRKHSQGVWVGRSKIEQTVELIRLIDEYNRFFKYKYNDSFLKFKETLANYLLDLQTLKSGKEFLDIEYIDDDMLRPKLRALQIEIAEIKQTIQLLSDRLNEREQEIHSREQEIRFLLAQLKEHEDQINEIHQSTSWKITQPMRIIKSLVERLLDLLFR